MHADNNLWAVVLAAGSGNRLRSLTLDELGTSVPKQYCSLTGENSPLGDALARARRLAAPDHIATIVAAEHHAWWRPQLANLPCSNVFEQPKNRGTAVGILLSALYIQQRDRDAVLVFFPSDHFIRDEAVIAGCLSEGLAHLATEPDNLFLLGITPDEVDTELGYIVPATTGARVVRVREFVEKPDLASACALIAAGSMWNSFIFAVRASSLIALFARRHTDIVDRLRRALLRDDWVTGSGKTLVGVYECLIDLDFSRYVLAGNVDHLRMLPTPPCGWTDLGTPARVGRYIETLGKSRPSRRPPITARNNTMLNLADAYTHRRMAV